MILVQASENDHKKNNTSNVENISSGWVVLRSCTEFHVSFYFFFLFNKKKLYQIFLFLYLHSITGFK